MSTEKRRHPRYVKNLVVIFRYKSLDHFVKAVTENISLGGLCLQVERDIGISQDQMIHLQFQLEATNEIVEIEGQVKWLTQSDETEDVQIGVEFLRLENPEMHKIKEKLKLLLEKS